MRPGSGASSSASWTSWSSHPKASPDDYRHAGHEGRPPARGAMMRGPSRASLAAAREQLMAALADPSGAAALGDELFAVAHLLDQEPGLRRALTDATSPVAAREGLVSQLLDGRVAAGTLDLMAGMVRNRWAAGRDLADAAEQLGVLATAAAAESEGQLDDLEDELFRFGRIVSTAPDLRSALSDPKRLAAAWRQRLLAVVRVAGGLDEDQRARLTAALSRTYGRDIHLNVVIDPEVVGGMSIQIGDEFIDGSLASRLAQLRQRLAS